MGRAVCNASPIIGLIKIDKLNLLWELFEEVFIPQAVYDELTSDESRYDTQILALNKAINSEKIRVFKVTNQEFIKQLNSRLHSGEIEVYLAQKSWGLTQY